MPISSLDANSRVYENTQVISLDRNTMPQQINILRFLRISITTLTLSREQQLDLKETAIHKRTERGLDKLRHPQTILFQQPEETICSDL